jgi:hypothetical protein
LLEIGKALAKGCSLYDATRGCWRVNRHRVEGRIVLGHAGGVVRAAYRPSQWVPASGKEIPAVFGPSQPSKWFFEGSEAEPDVRDLYVGHSLPLKYRPKPGAQGGIRYVEPEGPRDDRFTSPMKLLIAGRTVYDPDAGESCKRAATPNGRVADAGAKRKRRTHSA